MYLIQLLLPLYDNEGHAFPRDDFESVRQILVERFGGVTAFHRAPAEGLWRENKDATVRDKIVIYEVMSDDLDRRWWATFQEELEQQFRQEELVVRALPMERL